LDFTDTRTQLLDLDAVIEQSFDPYVFERDAYLQRRNYLIRKNQGLCDKEVALTPSLPTPDAKEDNKNNFDKNKTDLKKTGKTYEQ
jgi:ABC-type transporter lipoprotein component MlaA